MEQRIPGAQETYKNTLGTCSGLCSRNLQPQAALWSRGSSGAVLRTAALTAALRWSSSLWLPSPRGSIRLGQDAAWPSIAPPLPFQDQEVPDKGGSVSLKGFQCTEANLPHPNQPIQTLSSTPITSPTAFFPASRRRS